MKKLIMFIGFFMTLSIATSFFYDRHPDEVVVAVIDSGVDYDNPIFKGKIINGIDFVDLDFTANDESGHGTHVSSIILRGEKEAKLIPIRILREDGKGNGIGFLGIMWAILHDADVVNMSFSENYNLLTKWLIRYGEFKGMIFVGSAGNQGKHRINYPANYNGVISVAGFDRRGIRTNINKHSNYTEKIDIVAPYYQVGYSLGNELVVKSGTSMAAAYISGVAATLKKQEPTLNKKEIIEKMYQLSQVRRIVEEKVEAFKEKTPYLRLYVEFSDYITQKSTIEFKVDALNLEKADLFVNEKRIKTFNFPTEENIRIPLETGMNKIHIKSNDVERIVQVISDRDEPRIKQIETVNDGTVKILVEDEYMKQLSINGETAYCSNCREERTIGKKTYVYYSYIKNTPYVEIQATDKMNRKVTQAYKKQ